MNNIKPLRAWNGKLSHIEAFLQWMYDNGMSKSDRELKDRVARKYYRYYNDGDIPRGFRYETDETTQHELEQIVNEMFSKLLRKYMTTAKRREYRIATLKADLKHTNALETGTNRIPGLLNYYAAQLFAERYNLPELKGINDQIDLARKQLARLEAKAGRIIVDDYMQNPHRTTDNELDFQLDMYNRFKR